MEKYNLNLCSKRMRNVKILKIKKLKNKNFSLIENAMEFEN